VEEQFHHLGDYNRETEYGIEGQALGTWLGWQYEI
jgi:hypothetical protein